MTLLAAIPIGLVLSAVKSERDNPPAPWADIDLVAGAVFVFFTPALLVVAVALGLAVTALVRERHRYLAVAGTALSLALLSVALVLLKLWWRWT